MDGEVRFAEVGPARVGFAVHGRGDLDTSSLVDLLTGPDHRFSDRGERELKGLPGAQRLFAAGSR